MTVLEKMKVITHVISPAVISPFPPPQSQAVVHIPSLMLGAYQRDQFIDLNISAPAKGRDGVREDRFSDAGCEQRSVAS